MVKYNYIENNIKVINMSEFNRYKKIIEDNLDRLDSLDFVNNIEILKLQNDFDKEAAYANEMADGKNYKKYVQEYKTIAHVLADKGFVFENNEILNIKTNTGFVAESMARKGNIPLLDKDQEYYSSVVNVMLELNYQFNKDFIIQNHNSNNNLILKQINYYENTNDLDLLKLELSNGMTFAHHLVKSGRKFQDFNVLSLTDKSKNTVAHFQLEKGALDLDKNDFKYNLLMKQKNNNGQSVLSLMAFKGYEKPNNSNVLLDIYTPQTPLDSGAFLPKKQNYQYDYKNFETLLHKLIQNKKITDISEISFSPEEMGEVVFKETTINRRTGQEYTKENKLLNYLTMNGYFDKNKMTVDFLKEISPVDLFSFLDNPFSNPKRAFSQDISHDLEFLNKRISSHSASYDEDYGEPIGYLLMRKNFFNEINKEILSLEGVNNDSNLVIPFLTLVAEKRDTTEGIPANFVRGLNVIENNPQLLKQKTKSGLTALDYLFKKISVENKYGKKVITFSNKFSGYVTNNIDILSMPFALNADKESLKNPKSTVAHFLAFNGVKFDHPKILNLKDADGISVEDVQKNVNFSIDDNQNKAKSNNIENKDYSTIVFNFGKYNGKTVEFVLETNPQYISWLSEKNNSFVVKNINKSDIDKAIEKLSNKEKIENNVNSEWKSIVLNFGKHKDKTLGDVAKENPNYVTWAYDKNLKGFNEIPESEILKLKQKSKPTRPTNKP